MVPATLPGPSALWAGPGVVGPLGEPSSSPEPPRANAPSVGQPLPPHLRGERLMTTQAVH